MIRRIRLLSVLILLVPVAAQVHAQTATGTPLFGSFGGGPDVINLANLNSHITVPILQKPGRGTDFAYDLSYDSSVWYPLTSGSTKTWQPTNNWGWSGLTATTTGFISYDNSVTLCFDSHHVLIDAVATDTHFVYHDPYGIAHAFGGTYIDPGECPTPAPQSVHSRATDGSGYWLDMVSGSGNPGTITTSTGTVFYPPNGVPTGASSKTDRNGNKITADGAGHFYDTLSSTSPVLTVSGNGTTSSPLRFTYTSPSGGSPYYQVNYTNYTVATNFGISGIGEYKSSAAVPLISSIVLPDNSQYSFLYEPTPGTCTPYSGTTCVTARITSITLPTGGTTTYAYSGGNNGILSDGSTAILTRVTPDGSWTYAQVKGTGAASTTTVTDPANNQTVIQFQYIYETQRKAYQGSAGGTLLQTTNTCYNASTSPCTGAAITLPISQRTVNATIPGSGNLQSQHTDKFDAYGNVTESDDYDFATGAPFPLLRQTLITYASLGGYLNAFQQTVLVKDGSGTIKSRQVTNYDQYSSFTGANCITNAPNHDNTGHGCNLTARANATSTVSYTDPVTPGGALTKSFTYDSLGNLRSAQLNCCQNKTWAYSATTGYAYPDSITSGSSSPTLTTNFTYDLHMGLVLTSTDPNNLQATLTYDNLGRTLTSQVGNLPATNYTYTDSGTWSVKVCSPVQGANTVCQKSILDSQGRIVTSQLLDGGGTPYSAKDTQYDAFGRAYKVSNPYTGAASNWIQTYFDTLGRAYQTTLPDNSSSMVNYADNTATTTDPSGKQRKAVADGLGRLTSVFEPDPSNNNTLTFQTSYAYNVFDKVTQVTQGAQTRSYLYDALGRLLSSTTPEGGRTCFGSVTGSTCNADGYDSFDNLLKRTDSRGVLTSYGYDGLNRVSSVSYNVGTTGVPATSTVSLTYGPDSSCNTAHGSGCIGQLITMTDGPGSENYTYNSLEQMTQLQKVISGTTYTTQYAYNLAGELTQITYPSNRVIQQSVDPIGRLCEIAPSTNGCGTASSPYATGYGYGAAGQLTGFRYGNGIYASLGFSNDRLQLNCLDYSTTNRGSTCAHDGTTKFGLDYSYGGVGANNGQIAGINDAVDSGRSAAYTYDALSRLTSAVTTGSTGYAKWGVSETYDRFGNRSDQNQTFGNPPMNHVTIDATTNRISGYCYDLNGDLLAESAAPCPSPTYTYDAENRLVNYMSTNPTYVYDGNGLRVKKCISNCTSPTTTTVYIFSGSKVIAEYDNGAEPSAPSREYIYGGSALLARIAGSTTTYYHQDHLSNRLVTSPTGATLAQMGHFPFGESWYNSTGDKLLFTTYERDAESGNDYAIARYDISRLGRFGSPDPLYGFPGNPQSLNRYPYTQNDPINATDPSDLVRYWCDVEGCRSGGGGGGRGGCRSADDLCLISIWGLGGGGPTCRVDGVDAPCSIAYGLLRTGAGIPCPNNNCSNAKIVNGSLYITGWVSVTTITSTLHDCATMTPYIDQASCEGSISMEATQGWGSVSLGQPSDGGIMGAFWTLMDTFWDQVPISGAAYAPIPHTGGLVAVMFPGAYIPKQQTGCVGLGLAATTPTGKFVGGGPLVIGDIDNARNILSGFGYNFSAQACV